MSRSLFCFLLLLFAATAQSAIPPGINGSWYDPEHPGHGLSIQIQDDGRAIAYWFVYDTQGNPIHLYVDGAIDDRTIRGPAYRAQGMRFGAFDPATLSLARWGRVSIAFNSCNAASLTYYADDPSFGSATIPLARLSQLATQRCDERELAPLPVGVYTGRYRQTTQFGRTTADYAVVGIVDPDGKVWAHDAERRIPGPGYFPFDVPAVIASPTSPRIDAERIVLDARSAFADALEHPEESRLGRGIEPLPLAFDGGGTITGTGGALSAVESVTLDRDPAASQALEGRLDLASLADTRYFTELRGYLGVPTAQLWIRDAAGGLCLRISNSECAYEGRLRIRSTTHRVFDFELTHTASGIRYTGRGWLDRVSPERIHLVGLSDRNGLYYTAFRQ